MGTRSQRKAETRRERLGHVRQLLFTALWSEDRDGGWHGEGATVESEKETEIFFVKSELEESLWDESLSDEIVRRS
jgi:hypothetical protein